MAAQGTPIPRQVGEMNLPIWMLTAEVWLKKYWKWLLLPIGLLLWLLGRLTAKKTVTITSTAIAEADEAKGKINAEAAEKVREADAKEAAQLAGISAQQAAAVARETQKQVDAAAEAQGDPDAVNALLIQTGKDARR